MPMTYAYEGELWLVVARDEAIGYNQETSCTKGRAGEQEKFLGKA